MNKAVTEGIVFTPPEFVEGLDVWSSGDGTPGSDTYENAADAVFVPADADFGGCLEMLKLQDTQQLRYMGQTPLARGCYLRITARVKAVSGNLPTVRIAGWAGQSNGSNVPNVTQTGPETTLTSFGQVVEISAIVGSGNRGGVDMVWGPTATYGHFGLDLTGATGGVVRVDDLIIEDISGVFLRDLIATVDVRDYGAIGDGVTDDSAAFEAADAAANGRTVRIPAGTHYLAESVNFASEVIFEGTVSMPVDKMLLLTKNFDLPSYIDAFGNEELAFKKAFQALLNNSDHESLDMAGRRIHVTAPIDMQAAVSNRTSYQTRRAIRNGQLDVQASSAWDADQVSSQASYDTSRSRTLTNVTNVANVPVGALVQGNGVGREIYVRSINVGAGEVTLSEPLYGPASTQTYTFTRFKYALDFSGFSRLDKFILDGIEVQCNTRASGIMLAPAGLIFQVNDCYISRPLDRGITSIGSGCQGMLISRCHFLSAEDADDVVERTSIALNTNSNDLKLRNCRATRFRHFAVIGGDNTLFRGNHFFQGDGNTGGVRSAGIVITSNSTNSIFTGNYIDNCSIEWTNERDPTPDFTGGFSFSGLTISDNVFLSGNVTPSFSYLVVKPFGSGHFLNGVTITGNRFRSLQNNIDRVDRVDDSIAALNPGRMKNVTFTGNSYLNVSAPTANPLRVNHIQSGTASTWLVASSGALPFGGRARTVDGIVTKGAVRNASNQIQYVMPYVSAERGTDGADIELRWPQAVRGTATVTMRIDN